MSIADYYNGFKMDEEKNESLNNKNYLTLDQRTSFSHYLLDNLIDMQEKMHGFSIFNRGANLSKSLINENKVKRFINQHDPSNIQNQEKEGKKRDNQDEWHNMIQYFEKNPSVFLDAIPV